MDKHPIGKEKSSRLSFILPWKSVKPESVSEQLDLPALLPREDSQLIGIAVAEENQFLDQCNQDNKAAAKISTKSDVGVDDLASIAGQPYATEEAWLKACTELNARENKSLTPDETSLKKKWFLLPVLLVAVGFVAVSIPKEFPGPSISSTSKVVSKPYVLSSSELNAEELKDRAIVAIAESLDERGWTSSQAASYLDVSEQEIAKLMTGEPTSFSMESINKMLLALGEPSSFPETPTTKESMRAIAYYTRMIGINPNDSIFFAKRASAYAFLNQRELSIADHHRCVELEPNRPGPRNNLATALMAAGKTDESLQILNELQNKFPQYDTHQNRALVFNRMGELELAAKECTKSIQLMKTPRPGPYLNRAATYEKLGKFEQALADYKKVLQIDPRYETARVRIARLERDRSLK